MKSRITRWLDPDDAGMTQYGDVTNREWMHHEVLRMAQKGIKAKVVTHSKRGYIAIEREIV